MALPRSRSFIGIAKDAARPTPGTTPTATVASDYIPFTSFNPQDMIKYLDDKGIRGSMTEEFDVIQGSIHSEIDLAGDVYPDTVGYIFGGVFGEVAFTAGTPNQHAFTLYNSVSNNSQPISFSMVDYFAGIPAAAGVVYARTYAGCQWQSIDTKFTADGLMSYSAKAMGYQSTTTTTIPTPSFSTVAPLPSWLGTVTIDGVATATLADGNVNISRTVEPIFTVDGNQNPYQLFAGPMTVSGSLKLVYENDTNSYTRFVNNTRGAMVIDFTSGVAATQTQVKFQMSKCAFTVAKIDRSKDFIEIDLTYKGLANTTDIGVSAGYGPCKVTLKNTKATGVYG